MSEDVLDAIRKRRSIRRYKPEKLPRELVDGILEVAFYAPNAGNRQSARIVVCQNDEANRTLGHINKLMFAGAAPKAGTVSTDQPSLKDDASIQDGFYGARTVVYVFGLAESWYREADCWILADQISLAAFAKGVGTCLVSRAEKTFDTEEGRAYQKAWDIPEEYVATVAITMGWPEDGFPEPRPRKYAAVTYVD